MTIPTTNVAPWANDYIGIPYADHGRDRRGLNCWGLVHLIAHERLGIDLPELDGVSWRTARRHGNWPGFIAQGKARGWRTLWEKQSENELPPRGIKLAIGDGLLLRGRKAIVSHCGMVVGAPWFIHAVDEIETSLARFDTDPWKWNVAGVYRWEGARC